MSTFVPAPHDILLSDKRICQIVRSVCGKEFSSKTLPVSLRVALFCVLISLIPCIPSEMFEIAVGSALSIMKLVLRLILIEH